MPRGVKQQREVSVPGAWVVVGGLLQLWEMCLGWVPADHLLCAVSVPGVWCPRAPSCNSHSEYPRGSWVPT